MRWVHMAIVILFVGALLIFVGQNFQTVTMSFLSFSIRMPLAVLAVIVYVLGMVSGGSLWSLLRKSIEGSRGPAGA